MSVKGCTGRSALMEDVRDNPSDMVTMVSFCARKSVTEDNRVNIKNNFFMSNIIFFVQQECCTSCVRQECRTSYSRENKEEQQTDEEG